jgi:polyketide synthase 12
MSGEAVARDEAIAIVGLSCRLPGAGDPAVFWNLLRSGASAIGRTPPGRWDSGPPPDADPACPEGAGAGWGGFLDRVEEFDAAFFGIPPRVAAAMDPQQRLMLELGWEALEDAGIVPGRLRGSRTGVFVAVIWDDYAALVHRAGPAAVTAHTLTGLHRSIIANRLSHTLGLRGPSLAVDTGQSSSLVAVHLAGESLRRGESSLALVGGVNLILAPDSTAASARFGGLSPDGRCRPFDAEANGYVRGEGGAVVVLEPLSQALAAGHPVRAVICGSAVNNDGGGGLTVPDPRAQAEVLRVAYARAGVDAVDVGYVQLHGTGTPVGDPVEAAALGAVLGAARPAGSPLPVGSAKANVGHLEGAAGVVGLLAAVLSLEHAEIPPSLGFAAPHPDIPLQALNLRVQTELAPWPRGRRPRLAGVSSFGMGGTNCHVVLAEGPAPHAPDPVAAPPAGADKSGAPLLPWVVSAGSGPALRAQARRLGDLLAAEPGVGLADVGFSLATTRSTFAHRAVVLAADRDGFSSELARLSRGEPAAGVVQGVAGEAGGTVFVFPGQGAQWAGMGLDLWETSPVFAASMQACADALAPFIDWSLRDVLRPTPGAAPSDRVDPLDRVEVVQPALFAVMVSLAALWRSLGVAPDAVVGHSQGEIAAACVAGGLSLDDAARIVALRSRALAGLAGGGAMASIPLPVGEVRRRLAGRGGRLGWLGVAAVNGPATTAVSGSPQAVEAFVADCRARDIRARTISVDYASHSPQVEAVRAELVGVLAGIRPRRSQVAFYSTVTGGLLDTTGLDADYWYRNLRQTVHLDRAVRALREDGHRLFLEPSPHPVLTAPIQENLDQFTRDTDIESCAVVMGGGVVHIGGQPHGVADARTAPQVKSCPSWPARR